VTEQLAFLREALQFNAKQWDEAVEISNTRSLLDGITFIYDTWSKNVGSENSTVGVICDLLHSVGREGDAGKYIRTDRNL
jgi:hypothetical protein